MHIPGFSVPDPSVPLEQASRQWNNDVNQPPNSSATASSETAGESQNGVNHFTRLALASITCFTSTCLSRFIMAWKYKLLNIWYSVWCSNVHSSTIYMQCFISPIYARTPDTFVQKVLYKKASIFYFKKPKMIGNIDIFSSLVFKFSAKSLSISLRNGWKALYVSSVTYFIVCNWLQWDY